MIAWMYLFFLFALWMKGSTLLVDNSGQPIDCPNCPCDCICENCAGPACPGSYTIVIEDFANSGCSDCAGSLNGEYTVTRDLGENPDGCSFTYTFSPTLCNGTGFDITRLVLRFGVNVGPTEYPLTLVIVANDGDYTFDNFPFPGTPETCDLDAFDLPLGSVDSFGCDSSSATVTVFRG